MEAQLSISTEEGQKRPVFRPKRDRKDLFLDKVTALIDKCQMRMNDQTKTINSSFIR